MYEHAGNLNALEKTQGNSVPALYVLKEKAISYADPFEVCNFPSPTFCFFCTKLTSIENYFIRLVFKLAKSNILTSILPILFPSQDIVSFHYFLQ